MSYIKNAFYQPYSTSTSEQCFQHIHSSKSWSHGGIVVMHNPPNLVSINLAPYFGKVVVAHLWPAVYISEP